MYTSQLQSQLSVVLFRILSRYRGIISGLAGVQFNRHLKFKAWVKDKVKDAFRKALDGEMVKAWVKAWVKTLQNVY